MYASQDIQDFLERQEELAKLGRPFGIASTITELDELLDGGFSRGSLTYIVGESSIGKTWLGLWIILNAAMNLARNPELTPVSFNREDTSFKKPLVIYWSLELSKSTLISRLLAQAAWAFHRIDIDDRDIRLGPAKRPETYEQLKPVVEMALQTWGKTLLLHCDSRTTEEFERLLYELTIDHDVVLVVMDYFRLAETFESSGVMAQETRSAALASMVKEFDLALVALFDVNRQGQKEKRIGLEHMRFGNAAQYDADHIIILNRHEFSQPVLKADDDSFVILDVELKKNRLGRMGKTTICLCKHNGAVSEGQITLTGGNNET